MKPSQLKICELGGSEGVAIGSMNAAEQIKAAIKKAVPTVHPVIAHLVLGVVSTTGSMASAAPIFLAQMQDEEHAEAFETFVNLVINNGITAVLGTARLMGEPEDDARAALVAGGKEAFRLTHEGLCSMADALQGSRGQTIN